VLNRIELLALADRRVLVAAPAILDGRIRGRIVVKIG